MTKRFQYVKVWILEGWPPDICKVITVDDKGTYLLWSGAHDDFNQPLTTTAKCDQFEILENPVIDRDSAGFFYWVNGPHNAWVRPLLRSSSNDFQSWCSCGWTGEITRVQTRAERWKLAHLELMAKRVNPS